MLLTNRWILGLSATLAGATACLDSDFVAIAGPWANSVKPAISSDARRSRKSGYEIVYDLPPGGSSYYPVGGVFVDDAGNIFGTTLGGGTGGTVFEATPHKHVYAGQVIHTFSCTIDGCNPASSPIEDATGNVYATVSDYYNNIFFGGGTAVQLTPSGSNYVESGIYTFGNGSDGANPIGGFMEQGGRLFTTTVNGGKYGKGAIIAMVPGGFTEEDLYDFGGSSNDGANPYAGLVADRSGVLYGTTSGGGAKGRGTIFKFAPGQVGGSETVLYDFPRNYTGAAPRAGVVLDQFGNIYGMTEAGVRERHYTGLVFKLVPSDTGYQEQVLHEFTGGTDGSEPVGTVTLLGGQLYGLTSKGGTGCNCGTIFKLSPDGSAYSVVFAFSGDATGFFPGDSLFAKGNALYGTAEFGGSNGDGVVFRYVP
jgi:uncharacterized repeat protein (TIGR03803 family)